MVIQRSRLIAGAVAAIEELGYTQATVGQITRHASVSRRTFYELFANREECLMAVLEQVVELVTVDLATAGLGGLAWRERVRRGLAAILAFCDREPVLARVCVVQALRGGPGVLERREEVLAGLAAVLDEGREGGLRGGECTPLTAEGLVGAAFSIVYARLQRGEEQPLTELLNELMAMIVLPYLGPAAARREQARPLPDVPRGEAGASEPAGAGNPMSGLGVRFTYRTAMVLEGVREHPGASNREVAGYAEVLDPAQISRLLGRLERVGLIVNTGGGHARGAPNAWTLTAQGEQVAGSIRMHTNQSRAA
ncbi:MAG TPA: TetR/AcrR family transcriptional regulator [Solirubrobacteraceae bacterium]|jgi:AcrR family transcriptional regulator|nr:TetR/AcrR family transcriptional regulator [Solirubrobacteraceae bacterium]